jgi:hypothetical protein
MKLYKLTDEFGQTRGRTQWGNNITHKAAAGKPVLCSITVLHAYTSPLLAVLLNPVHAAIRNPMLWEAEGEPVVKEWGKVGCKTLTTLSRLPLPSIGVVQKTAFAILCALEVYKKPTFVEWAKKWLSGEDRSRAAANAATYAAYAAANTAANAAYAAANAAANADPDFAAIALRAMEIS